MEVLLRWAPSALALLSRSELHDPFGGTDVHVVPSEQSEGSAPQLAALHVPEAGSLSRSRWLLAAAAAEPASAHGASQATGANVNFTPQPIPTRAEQIARLKSTSFDVLVIGGGATGAGVALDAASRGLSVALVERDDFAAGTSSKSTKLVHGGVRYLEKAFKNFDLSQYELVKEALNERETVLQMAPHLAQQVPIMVPLYRWWLVPYYWAGLKAYELIARLHYRSLFGQEVKSSYYMRSHEALERLPVLRSDGLCGAVVYYDGQFDDAGLNLAVALSAVDAGAVVVNHAEVKSLLKADGGLVSGARVVDRLTGEEIALNAKVVINATGPFADSVRTMDNAAQPPIVQGSSGIHITLPLYFGSQTMGMLDPQTSDGRVVFMLPWEGVLLVGTTDAPCPIEPNPVADTAAIDFVLNEFRKYLQPGIKVSRDDVLSAWSGIRPLVNPKTSSSTQEIVRSHYVDVSSSGLVTVTGGKWTTYRKMAEDTVDAAVRFAGLQAARCTTAGKPLRGAANYHRGVFVELIQRFRLEEDVARYLAHRYGDRAATVAALATKGGTQPAKRLHPRYPFLEAQVEIAVREEYACNAADVLLRRLRLAFIDSRAALAVLPRVIEILSSLHGWSGARTKAEHAAAQAALNDMVAQITRAASS